MTTASTEHVLDALGSGDGTNRDVVERTGLSLSAVKRSLGWLRSIGVVRVVGHRPNGRYIYGLAPDEEAA